MEASYSWKITAPARTASRVIRTAPGYLWRRFKLLVRAAVRLLPPDNIVRRGVIRIYERGGLLLRGQVDNELLQ